MDRTVFQGALVRRSQGLLVGGILATVAGLAVVAALPQLGGWILVGALVALASYGGWSQSRESRMELRVGPDGLHAGGSLVVARSAIRGVRILPRRQKGPIIEIRTRGLSRRVSVRSAKQARELVRGLGRDPREGLARFTVSLLARTSAVGLWMWIAVFGFLAAVAGAGGPKAIGIFFGALAAVLLGVSRLFRQTVTIGTDGILVESLAGNRFLRYADIRSMDRLSARSWTGQQLASPGFVIWPKVGAPVRIHTLHERMRDGMYVNDHLFSTARKLLRRKSGEESPHFALLRGARTAAEWLGALRATEVAGYRSIVLDTEDLLRVVADPGATDEMRAGAIAALSGRKEARARLRVIAEDVATPRLRVALDAALEEDEERLLHALDDVVTR